MARFIAVFLILNGLILGLGVHATDRAKPRVRITSAVQLQAITVTPANPVVPVGETLQFKAFGMYSDGTERDITDKVIWSSNDLSLTISNSVGSEGLATGVGPSTNGVIVTASHSHVEDGKSELPPMDGGFCDTIKSVFSFFESIFSLVGLEIRDGCRSSNTVLHQFSIENDSLGFKNQDRFYTNGIFYEQVYLGGQTAAETERENFGFNVGQLIYTASDINIAEPDVEGRKGDRDRPYAGYLFAGLFWEQTRKNDPSGETLHFGFWNFFRLGAELGCTGPCSQAESAQTIFHDLATVGSLTPQGWRNQVPEQVGLNFHATVVPLVLSWNAFPTELGGQRATVWDAYPVVRLNAGEFFNDASLGVVTRLSLVGRMNSLFEAGSISSTTTAIANNNRGFNFNLFASFTRKRVFHNALLRGPRNNKYAFKADAETVVEEQAGGFQFGKGGFGFSYTYTERSSEIKGSSLDDENHGFGKFQFSWIQDFN